MTWVALSQEASHTFAHCSSFKTTAGAAGFKRLLRVPLKAAPGGSLSLTRSDRSTPGEEIQVVAVEGLKGAAENQMKKDRARYSQPLCRRKKKRGRALPSTLLRYIPLFSGCWATN